MSVVKSNQKLSRAIASILGASALGLTAAQAASAADSNDAPSDSSEGIQEITVTAQRRTENQQSVPITIQAITGDSLKEQNISTFEDVIKLLPNVTVGTNGPGQGSIFMRGLSTGAAGGQSSATIAPFPNVAVYLDDQSMQFPGRNADVYFADMERIEVLEGPQGTLFGGGAEAGAIRYITNKPKLNVTEGNVEGSYGITAGGDPNSSANATINLPLIQDTLAVRAVIYDDRRGGYIDNVPSTFTRKNTDLGAFYANISPVNGQCPNGLPNNGHCIPLGLPVGNNYAIAQNNSNPVEYNGIRASALYQINDDWSLLVAQSYQNMEADGVFTQYPVGSDGQKLGPDQVTTFTPAFDKDRYENTAWTVNGKVGVLNAVYTGGYMDRHIEQQNDYTNYSRSAGGWYYSCIGGTNVFGTGLPVQCYSPVTSWRDDVRNTHQSHEFRLSTPDDWRMRGIAGAYWEDFEIQDVMNFNYKTIPSCTPENLATAEAGGTPCVGNVTTAPGSTSNDPGPRGDSTAFGEDTRRGYKQTAFFGSADYDLIPKVLTITGGTRWYRYTEFESGSQYSTPAGCENVANGTCTAGDTNIDAENLHQTYSGFRSRGNLTWHITPDIMAYYTFSQGFRPGAFNRTVSGVAKDGNGQAQYEKPHGYAPDSLTNHEIGWKTEFFDHRLQFNGSLYHMEWDNVQMLFFNPQALGNTTFGVNGPNYTINGVELQFAAKVTQGLTIQGSGSWNHSKQTTSPCLVSNIPASPTFGQCITQVRVSGEGVQPFENPFGAEGTVPAFSPPLEYNLRARYDWIFGEYNSFVTFGANHVGHMFNQPATYQSGDTPSEAIPTTTLLRYEQPGYTTFDASLGVTKDQWTAQLYGTNLSNSNASVFTSSAQFIKSEVPLRPRVLGLRLGYKF